MPPKGSTKAAPAPSTPDPTAGPSSSALAVPDTPSMAQQRLHTAGLADFELPKTTLTKLAKGSIPDNVKMQQDVVLALMRSSTVFISYLTAASHDQALARSGKSITASDVIKAIVEMDFGPADNLVPLLEHELAAYRNLQQAAKASKAKPPGPGRGRKRKPDASGEGDVEVVEGEDEEEGEGEGEDEAEQEGEGDGEGEGEGEDLMPGDREDAIAGETG